MTNFMKSSFVLLFLINISVLSSCQVKEEQIIDDYKAVAIANINNEIKISPDLYMNQKKIGLILFIYHDTVFQAKLEGNKTTYAYLNWNKQLKDSLNSCLGLYKSTNLKKQLKDLRENGILMTCSPEGYFLFSSNEQLNFGLFNYRDLGDLVNSNHYKEVVLSKNKFPKIYTTIYHTFNSKIWDYYMSNDYYYKENRTYKKVDFVETNFKQMFTNLAFSIQTS